MSYHAVQSAVCRQDSTPKPLVVPKLYVILCPIISFEASSRCKHDVGPPPSLTDLLGAPPVGALSGDYGSYMYSI